MLKELEKMFYCFVIRLLKLIIFILIFETPKFTHNCMFFSPSDEVIFKF